MKKFRIAAILLSMIFAVGSASVALSACSGQSNSAKVEVVYHLNYDDAGERTVEIPTGTTAVDWNAPRDGFKLKDWYTDRECNNAYDFSQKVTSNLNLYAAWTVYEGKVAVTFNYNYPGSRSSFTISVDKNGTIDESYAPTADKVDRLGMKLNGWYKDSACTQLWNFASDTASSDMTLYAGYVADNTIPRDAEGNIVYDNVQVNVWLADNGKGQAIFSKLAEEFNEEYAGKIQVNATSALLDQNTYSVRLQSTPEKSVNESTYYSISDIYAMADIEFSLDDWYEGALQDSLYKGALTSVPMLASVPYIVYNKTLMQKYNDGNLPKNYSELSALLKKAYEGEANQNFKSIMTNTDWTFKEAPSSVAFLQNGAEYYTYDSETVMYSNNWSDPDVQNGAIKALSNMYNLFGVGGDCHGGTGDSSSYDDHTPINSVIAGNSLMCIVNYMCSNDLVKADSNLGVMPLSNLFTDNTDEAAARIPVHTFGLAFYRAGKVSDVQLAAGAVFADYCSKHSEAFTEEGWYPVRKSCSDPENFNEKYRDLLEQVGDPENFYTYSGYTNGKRIVNTICAEKYIVPMLSERELNFAQRIAEMTTAIGFEINN